MEALLPSDIAKLVYGYLIQEKCDSAAQTFLETSKHLVELYKAQKEGSTFNCLESESTLVNLLESFTDTKRTVKNFLDKDRLPNELHPRENSNHSQEVNDLVLKLTDILHLKESHDSSNGNNLAKNLSTNSEKRGSNDGTKEDIRDGPSGQEVDSNILQSLLDNTALHERLAENINKAIDSSGEISPSLATEKKIVEKALNVTEADPIFEELLLMLAAPRADEAVPSHDIDKENRLDGEKKNLPVNSALSAEESGSIKLNQIFDSHNQVAINNSKNERVPGISSEKIVTPGIIVPLQTEVLQITPVHIVATPVNSTGLRRILPRPPHLPRNHPSYQSQGAPFNLINPRVRTRGGLQRKVTRGGVRAIVPQINRVNDDNYCVSFVENDRSIRTTRSMSRKAKPSPPPEEVNHCLEVPPEKREVRIESETAALGNMPCLEVEPPKEVLPPPPQITVEGPSEKESNPEEIQGTRIEAFDLKEDIQKTTPILRNSSSSIRGRPSLSTPRRKSHVRALDFTTPQKNIDPRKACTSPRSSSQSTRVNPSIFKAKREILKSPNADKNVTCSSLPTESTKNVTYSSPTEGSENVTYSSPIEGSENITSPTEGSKNVTYSSPTEGSKNVTYSSPTEGSKNVKEIQIQPVSSSWDEDIRKFIDIPTSVGLKKKSAPNKIMKRGKKINILSKSNLPKDKTIGKKKLLNINLIAKESDATSSPVVKNESKGGLVLPGDANLPSEENPAQENAVDSSLNPIVLLTPLKQVSETTTPDLPLEDTPEKCSRSSSHIDGSGIRMDRNMSDSSSDKDFIGFTSSKSEPSKPQALGKQLESSAQPFAMPSIELSSMKVSLKQKKPTHLPLISPGNPAKLLSLSNKMECDSKTDDSHSKIETIIDLSKSSFNSITEKNNSRKKPSTKSLPNRTKMNETPRIPKKRGRKRKVAVLAKSEELVTITSEKVSVVPDQESFEPQVHEVKNVLTPPEESKACEKLESIQSFDNNNSQDFSKPSAFGKNTDYGNEVVEKPVNDGSSVFQTPHVGPALSDNNSCGSESPSRNVHSSLLLFDEGIKTPVKNFSPFKSISDSSGQLTPMTKLILNELGNASPNSNSQSYSLLESVLIKEGSRLEKEKTVISKSPSPNRPTDFSLNFELAKSGLGAGRSGEIPEGSGVGSFLVSPNKISKISERREDITKLDKVNPLDSLKHTSKLVNENNSSEYSGKNMPPVHMNSSSIREEGSFDSSPISECKDENSLSVKNLKDDKKSTSVIPGSVSNNLPDSLHNKSTEENSLHKPSPDKSYLSPEKGHSDHNSKKPKVSPKKSFRKIQEKVIKECLKKAKTLGFVSSDSCSSDSSDIDIKKTSSIDDVADIKNYAHEKLDQIKSISMLYTSSSSDDEDSLKISFGNFPPRNVPCDSARPEDVKIHGDRSINNSEENCNESPSLLLEEESAIASEECQQPSLSRTPDIPTCEDKMYSESTKETGSSPDSQPPINSDDLVKKNTESQEKSENVELVVYNHQRPLISTNYKNYSKLLSEYSFTFSINDEEDGKIISKTLYPSQFFSLFEIDSSISVSSKYEGPESEIHPDSPCGKLDSSPNNLVKSKRSPTYKSDKKRSPAYDETRHGKVTKSDLFHSPDHRYKFYDSVTRKRYHGPSPSRERHKKRRMSSSSDDDISKDDYYCKSRAKRWRSYKEESGRANMRSISPLRYGRNQHYHRMRDKAFYSSRRSDNSSRQHPSKSLSQKSYRSNSSYKNFKSKKKEDETDFRSLPFLENSKEKSGGNYFGGKRLSETKDKHIDTDSSSNPEVTEAHLKQQLVISVPDDWKARLLHQVDVERFLTMLHGNEENRS